MTEEKTKPVKKWLENSLDLPFDSQNSFFQISSDNQKSKLTDHLQKDLKFSPTIESAYSTTGLLSKQNQHLVNYPKYYYFLNNKLPENIQSL